jgi:MSHA biogenesis protein MshP
VVCTPGVYNDGETVPGTARTLHVFQVVATACNGAAPTCPDDALAASPGYIERQRLAIAYCEWQGGVCVGP